MRYNGLKGDGFIVLQSNANENAFIEHETMDEAKGFAALRNAEKPNVYIIYAPVAIVRPRLNADTEITEIGQKMAKQIKGGKESGR